MNSVISYYKTGLKGYAISPVTCTYYYTDSPSNHGKVFFFLMFNSVYLNLVNMVVVDFIKTRLDNVLSINVFFYNLYCCIYLEDLV